MKTLITLLAILTLIVGGICFYLFPPEFAVPLFLMYLAATGGFLYCHIRDTKLRKQWRQSPILLDSPQFDNFFWDLTLSNQDWYIEHILKKEGLENLIQKYETVVRQIWNDQEWEISKKISMSSVFVKRLESLMTTLEFNYGLKPH